MSLVSVLIPVTLLLVVCGLWAFFWAVRNGQFDDLETPSWEILVDDKFDATIAPSATAATTAAATRTTTKLGQHPDDHV